MTELLEEALSRLRELPVAAQDLAAEAILTIIDQRQAKFQLTPEQVEEVGRIRSDLKAGRMHLLSDDEAAAMWHRLGA